MPRSDEVRDVEDASDDLESDAREYASSRVAKWHRRHLEECGEHREQRA